MADKMPTDMTEEAVAEWLWYAADSAGDSGTWENASAYSKSDATAAARAVIALVREKVREGVMLGSDAGKRQSLHDIVVSVDEIVARVMGEEAPRG